MALADLSRRQKADITGAIQHAMAALECVARAVSGDSSPTLGKLLDRHPGLIPKPLDAVVEMTWALTGDFAPGRDGPGYPRMTATEQHV